MIPRDSVFLCCFPAECTVITFLLYAENGEYSEEDTIDDIETPKTEIVSKIGKIKKIHARMYARTHKSVKTNREALSWRTH